MAATGKRAAAAAPARAAPSKKARAARPPATSASNSDSADDDDDGGGEESLGSGFEDPGMNGSDAGSSENEFAEDLAGAGTLRDGDDSDDDQIIGDDGEDLYANLDAEGDEDDLDDNEDGDEEEEDDSEAGGQVGGDDDDDDGGWETVGTAPKAPLIAPAAELEKRRKAKKPKLSAAELRALAYAELTASPISNVLATRVAALLDPLTPTAPASSPLQPVLKELHAGLTSLPAQKPVSLDALRKKGRVVPNAEGTQGKWAKLELAWAPPRGEDVRLIGDWAWGGALKRQGEFFVDLAVAMPPVRARSGCDCRRKISELIKPPSADPPPAEGLSRSSSLRQGDALPRHARAAFAFLPRPGLPLVRASRPGLRARGAERPAQGRAQNRLEQDQGRRPAHPDRDAGERLSGLEDGTECEPRPSALPVVRSRRQQPAGRPGSSAADAPPFHRAPPFLPPAPDGPPPLPPLARIRLPRLQPLRPTSPSLGAPPRLYRLARVHVRLVVVVRRAKLERGRQTRWRGYCEPGGGRGRMGGMAQGGRMALDRELDRGDLVQVVGGKGQSCLRSGSCLAAC